MGCCYSREDRTNLTPVHINEKHQDILAKTKKDNLLSPEKRNFNAKINSDTGGQGYSDKDLSPNGTQKKAPSQITDMRSTKVEEEPLQIGRKTAADTMFDMSTSVNYMGSINEPLLDKQATQVMEIKLHNQPLQQNQLEEVKETQDDKQSYSSSQLRQALDENDSQVDIQSKSEQSPNVRKEQITQEQPVTQVIENQELHKTPVKGEKSQESSVKKEPLEEADQDKEKTELQNQRRLIHEFEPVKVDTIKKAYRGLVDVQGDKKEIELELNIDKAPAQMIVGEKTNEPTAKVSGRVNHETLEFDLLLNYEHHSENITGKFVDNLFEQIDGILYNEAAGFKPEDGNKLILTSM